MQMSIGISFIMYTNFQLFICSHTHTHIYLLCIDFKQSGTRHISPQLSLRWFSNGIAVDIISPMWCVC